MLDRLRITIIRSSRKTLALRVTGPDSAEVRAPRLMPKSQIDAFVGKRRAGCKSICSWPPSASRRPPPSPR